MSAQSPFFQMRISPEDRERLRTLAAAAGTSQAAVVKYLVREAFERKTRRNARFVAQLFDTAASLDPPHTATG